MEKKTLYLTPQANEMWLKLVEESGMTQTRYFEQLVRQQYEKLANPSNDILQQLKLLKHIENDTNKMTFLLLEMFNSFLHSMPTTMPQDYNPSGENPHSWLSQAENALKTKIFEAQYSNAIKGGNN